MVDFSQVMLYLGKVGDLIGSATAFVVQWLAGLGMQVNPEVAKAIWVLISVVAIYLGIKVIQTPMKWIIIILSIIIFASIGVSFLQ